MNDQLQNFEEGDSLRHRFGLTVLRNEPKAPPVDSELLEELALSENMARIRYDIALSYLERYQSWRDAFQQIVDDSANLPESPSPDDP
jgi:hypothetical protein